jgi:hypothetical protein
VEELKETQGIWIKEITNLQPRKEDWLTKLDRANKEIEALAEISKFDMELSRGKS